MDFPPPSPCASPAAGEEEDGRLGRGGISRRRPPCVRRPWGIPRSVRTAPKGRPRLRRSEKCVDRLLSAADGDDVVPIVRKRPGERFQTAFRIVVNHQIAAAEGLAGGLELRLGPKSSPRLRLFVEEAAASSCRRPARCRSRSCRRGAGSCHTPSQRPGIGAAVALGGEKGLEAAAPSHIHARRPCPHTSMHTNGGTGRPSATCGPRGLRSVCAGSPFAPPSGMASTALKMRFDQRLANLRFPPHKEEGSPGFELHPHLDGNAALLGHAAFQRARVSSATLLDEPGSALTGSQGELRSPAWR